MTTGRPMEHKSADGMAFEHYLRSGERLTTNEWLARQQRKFNPYHDELGRFTFATGGVGASGLASRPASPLRSPSPEPAAKPLGQRPVEAATASPAPARPRRMAEIPGFPDSGKTAWRASNDYAFEAAANLYNKKDSLRPGYAGHRTPEFLKAWAMRESGGEGDEQSFKTDPFQVNNPGDWPRNGEKARVLGLRKGQKMTPAVSAYAALEWLRHKAKIQDGKLNVIGFRNDRAALERYNGNIKYTRQSGAVKHNVWYAATILEMTARTAAVRK